MTEITMTAAQTRLYDDWTDLGVAMLRRLQQAAREQAELTGTPISILTVDGIVADVVLPKEWRRD